MKNLRVQADYIVASPDRVLHPGQVVIQAGQILDVGPVGPPADVTLEGVALIPGFINCHTHLEFSSLQQPFPPGLHFPEWISAVVRWRIQHQQSMDERELEVARRSAIAAGLAESYHAGTAVIADIVTPPWSPRWLGAVSGIVASIAAPALNVNSGNLMALIAEHLFPAAGPQVLALPEILGHQPERFETMLAWATGLRSQPTVYRKSEETYTSPSNIKPSNIKPSDVRLMGIGVSPHAPYSLRWDAEAKLSLQQATKCSIAAMHIAESPAEVEWVSEGTGPFAEFLQRLQIAPSAQRLQFSDAISLLSGAARGLLVHGYYLDENDLRLASAAGRLALVYCPRTCRHFQHRPPDLAKIARYLPVVLGTDSRASNPDLSMWRELLALRQMHPQLDPAVAFGMATNHAAAALGIAASFGSIAAGQRAHINALDLSEACRPDQLLEMITTPEMTGAVPRPLLEYLTR